MLQPALKWFSAVFIKQDLVCINNQFVGPGEMQINNASWRKASRIIVLSKPANLFWRISQNVAKLRKLKELLRT